MIGLLTLRSAIRYVLPCRDTSFLLLPGCQGSICGAPLNNDIRDVLNGNLQLCAVLQECQVRSLQLFLDHILG